MQRIKCIISYDGSEFFGYQVQLSERTVQAEIERVLKQMHRRQVRVTASGRTDAGVHALGQVIHFDTDLKLPADAWIRALNTMLPDDIAVHHAEVVPMEFHARFGASGKKYMYKIDLGKIRDPLKRNYAFHYPYALDIGKIREAARYLEGEHDFTSFSSARSEVKDKVRTIFGIDFIQEGTELTITYRGNGFLYNMVRILTGTLMEVGSGKREPHEMKEILLKRDRAAAGKTAPPQGLYLCEVYYGEEC